MGRGRHRATSGPSGATVATLAGVVLAGGASFGAGVATAAPAAPVPPPQPCRIGTADYVQPPAPATLPARPKVVALGAGKLCADAVTRNVLDLDDLRRYGLVRVPAAKPGVPAAPAPTAPVVTTTPARPTPAKPTPAPTSTTPTSTTPTSTTPSSPANPVVAPASGAVDQPAVPTVPPESTSVAAPAPVARVAPRAPVVPAAAPAVPVPAAPALVPATSPALPTGGAPLVVADAPSAAPIPLDAPVIAAVDPASYLDPLGAPGLGDVPGEPTALQTLGEDTAGVTTSSRVQALGLDGLHHGGGLPAVLGVTIMSGLAGFALRHRVLAGIRAATGSATGPAPDDLDPAPSGRHSA